MEIGLFSIIPNIFVMQGKCLFQIVQGLCFGYSVQRFWFSGGNRLGFHDRSSEIKSEQ